MTIKLYGVGGCGMNNLKRYAENGAFRNDFEFIGLDTSDRNLFQNDRVVFELLPDAHGSGSDVGKYAEAYPAFLKKVLSQHKTGDINILVYSGGGGTGPSMGPSLHRALLEEDCPTISIIIGDMSNINSATNTVRALLNLNEYVNETNKPVIFAYYENGKGKTEGQINADVSSFIDVLNVLLSDENQRIDRTDIHHFFFYNKVVKATPILSCIEVICNDDTQNYSKNGVAAISLFDNEDNIRQHFSNLLYAKAGIFAERFANPSFRSIHAVLDHGDAVHDLKAMLENQRSINAKINDMYQTKCDNVTPKVDVISSGGTFKKFDF